MNRNIKQTLLAPVVLLLAAAFGLAGCTADDDFNRLPQGSIPLRVGEVTVAGMKPGTRAAGGNASTRAVVSETPATGYTGIRKSRFVDGDVLNLTLSNDGGGTNTPVTATLTGGVWVLSEKAYVISGTTTIRAAHAGTEVTAGIRPDALEVTEYALDGQKVTFVLKHAHAMIDITLPTGSVPAGVTITSITLAANNGMTDETLTTVVEEETDGNHYRTIALPGTTANPGSVKSLTAVINGQSYVATLATPLTVAANKKYPISLTFKENKLTATVGAASLDWGAGETINIVPAGYTRVIRTPEDLAQFAKDVNDDAAGARTAVVLQAADLDLSRLKPAAEAGINPLTGTAYTYAATADDWAPIGNMGSAAFQGKYNGNGHTISNMKKITVDYGIGFFGNVKNAALTGINLRNGSITVVDCETQDCALFACNVSNSVVSLCSATGTIDVANAGGAGGFMARVEDGSYITRCSANVKVSNSSYSLSTFVTYLNSSIIAACSSTGDFMPTTGSRSNSGFVNSSTTSTVMGCYFGGATISSSTDFKANANISCYSPAGNGTFGDNAYTYTDCACAGTITLAGVTGSITPATAYAALTASNASLGDVKTLHWSAAEGYTLTEVTRTWYAADVWKDNGTAAPTLDLAYEGFDGLYEGQPANLLAIAGLTAYYVAPVDAGTDIEWGNIDFNAICPKGWHVPTKDEFVAMTGILDDKPNSGNYDAIKTAFASNYYWSSTAMEFDSGAYYLNVGTGGTSYLATYYKTSSFQVRCVRKK